LKAVDPKEAGAVVRGTVVGFGRLRWRRY